MPTIKSCLMSGRGRLSAGPHRDRAQPDAEFLLLHVLGKQRSWLFAHGDEDVSEVDCTRYRSVLERRYRGEPIQYITGEAEFYGLPFRVTPDVLIPRPETEHIVEKAIALARPMDKPRIVDVGTGSGAIAVALARHLPAAEITAIDLSPNALVIAKENAERNGVAERIRFMEGDLLAPVAGDRFEIVVSNPPYVATSERGSLDAEVRDYEPHAALFAGADGLDVYRRLIPASRDVLVPGGCCVLEVGYGQAPAVCALLNQHGFTGAVSAPDLQGIPRVIWAEARRPDSA